MFRKLRSIWSLETRLMNAIGNELSKAYDDVKKENAQLKQQLVNHNAVLSKIRADVSERMSKIEVLFEEEIKLKEAIRADKVREARKKT